LSIEEYQYLWDGSETGWALFHINANATTESPRYLVFNTETNRALVIEDNDDYVRVNQMIIEHGTPVFSHLP
jgi:hypothetical protein